MERLQHSRDWAWNVVVPGGGAVLRVRSAAWMWDPSLLASFVVDDALASPRLLQVAVVACPARGIPSKMMISQRGTLHTLGADSFHTTTNCRATVAVLAPAKATH